MSDLEKSACEQGNISKRIDELFNKHGEQVQIGKVLGVFSKGWLSIYDKEDYWHVMYTSDKNTHQPLGGPALAADFLKASGERKIGPMDLTGAWKSAISMWPVHDENEAIQVFEAVKGYINQAYVRSFG